MPSTTAALPSQAKSLAAPLGATPSEQGVSFRVWAPNADAVSVIGTFNQWDAARHPLVKDEAGNWSGEVAEARAGDEYLYAIRRGEQEMKRVDPRACKVTNSAGNGIIWSPAADGPPKKFEAPKQNELVIYEMHIGTFNAEKDKGVGTFASAIEKLPYLKDLGVNALEVMPVAEFAGDVSWGYNPAHLFAVESAYGGPDAFKAFIAAAHDHGIAVILDVVYNHLGPSDLSVWQFDGWHENGMGGIYFYNDWKANTPWGDTRPDYGRGEVRSFLRDNALMWLRDFGVDGLRWDMTVYIRTVKGNDGDEGDSLGDGWSLCQWINEDIHREFPAAVTIAEDLHNSDWIVKGTGAGGAGFSAQWDAGFVHPVREAMIVQEDAWRDLDAVIGAIKHRYDGDAFKRVVYSESHDEVANGKARLPTEISPHEAGGYFAQKRSTLGAALVLTVPGLPMLFQGQEFLEDEWFRDEVPVDWKKLEKHAGVHALYRDLIALRRNLGGVTRGLTGPHVETQHVNHLNKVLGLRRWQDGGPGDEVIVLMNLSAQPVENYRIGVPAPGLWRVRLNSDGRAYSADFGDHAAPDVEAMPEPLDGFDQHIVTGLGPYSVVIFSQDPV